MAAPNQDDIYENVLEEWIGCVQSNIFANERNLKKNEMIYCLSQEIL